MATTSGAFTPVSGRTPSLDTSNVPDEQTREDAVLMDSINSYPYPTAKLGMGYSNLERRPSYPSIFRIWWQEAGACLLVLAMMAAVIATILPHQDKPLPQWPYNLSINTLVAVYFIVIKAAMVYVLSEGLGQLKWDWFGRARPLHHLKTYDDASRGPWGALTLLWRLRGRAFIPSLGAIVIILSTILDPFGQQIITFYQCTNVDLSNLNATVERTTRVNGGLGRRTSALLNVLRSEMQNAIHQGFFQAQPLTAPFQCSTGTCIFPEKYSNAGWCTRCLDITDQVIRVDYPGSSNQTFTNFTLPQPPDPDVTPLFPPNMTVPAVSGGGAAMRFRTYSQGQGFTVQGLLGADPEYPISESQNYKPDAWIRNRYGAAECNLFACTQTYSANVTIGQLREIREVEAAEWGFPDELSVCGSFQSSSIEVACLNDEEKSSLVKAGYKIDADTAWLAYNFSSPVAADPDRYCWNSTGIYIRPHCIYQVDAADTNSISTYFNLLFPNTDPFGDILDAYGGLIGPALPMSIYQEGNVSFRSFEAAFKRVADSMTMYGRSRANESLSNPPQPLVGEVWVTNTCVRVQWVWLIYPAALVVLLLVFLACTVWSVRMGGELGRQDYKSSVLPLMFHTVERRNGGAYGVQPQGGIETKGEIEQEAKMRVTLERTEGGWRFKET